MNFKAVVLMLVLICPAYIYPQLSVKFAVIGDYGHAGPDELAVANLVKSWNPDFIVTTGDNNYDVGSLATIDQNIGQYYHEFIYPYFGTYGAGDTVNRFFPAPGNCDWGTPFLLPYLNYFTLPGNERYYDFIKGPVHFFIMDSDTNEYDGIDSNSIQAQWLRNALAVSSARFNIVVVHHPPYCSGLIHGSEPIMRWPFKRWGADAVMSGHEHLYERLTRDGLTYFVNGLGGNIRTPFGFPISGSQVRYNSNFGAILVNAYEDSLVLKFYNIANSLRDNFKILPAVKNLSLNVLIEGFYDPVLNNMSPDTCKVQLRHSNPPYPFVDSSASLINSSGSGSFNFKNADNATDYYLVLMHRNSLETWSSVPKSFTANNMTLDFTISSSQSFGNNMVLRGSRYCIYSGDAVKDGNIDLTDLVMIQNDAAVFEPGYVISDLNGDLMVDLTDELICYNNSVNFVTKIQP